MINFFVPGKPHSAMTRTELIERILWFVDGYRFGQWSLAEAGACITVLIEEAHRD